MVGDWNWFSWFWWQHFSLKSLNWSALPFEHPWINIILSKPLFIRNFDIFHWVIFTPQVGDIPIIMRCSESACIRIWSRKRLRNIRCWQWIQTHKSSNYSRGSRPISFITSHWWSTITITTGLITWTCSTLVNLYLQTRGNKRIKYKPLTLLKMQDSQKNKQWKKISRWQKKRNSHHMKQGLSHLPNIFFSVLWFIYNIRKKIKRMPYKLI